MVTYELRNAEGKTICRNCALVLELCDEHGCNGRYPPHWRVALIAMHLSKTPRMRKKQDDLIKAALARKENGG